jgi:hypothetical protein
VEGSVMKFDWGTASAVLDGFGGRQVRLTIPKTGMPFFDALRLYGAIDLYIGLREDVWIRDLGRAWNVEGRVRDHRLKNRDLNAFQQVWGKKKPKADDYCMRLRTSVETGQPLPADPMAKATKACKGLDSAFQAGVRHAAASEYSTLQGGQTSESTCCVAEIPLADGLLGFSGKKRIFAGVGDIIFLPIFEGRIDLARVVSPLRLWVRVPNVTCAQALALLALRTSLFAEGCQDRLSAVVFNTAFRGQRSDNFSGVIAISSTAVGRAKTPDLLARLYQVLRALVNAAWTRQGATSLVTDALAMARWLTHPLPKHLSSFITSQERLHRNQSMQVFVGQKYVREVFEMSIGSWHGDHEAVRRFARAVSSGIRWARGRDNNGHWLPDEEQRKNWYDEVTMLRSAPTAKAFVERAMILIEQGHREHSQVGTTHRDEAFDPPALLSSFGKDRSSFEAFRDLFRMYLVQESTYQPQQKELAESTEGKGAEEPADDGEEEEKQ